MLGSAPCSPTFEKVKFNAKGGRSIFSPSGPVTQNLTSPSGSGSGSGTASLPKMQPDIEAPIMTSTSIHACVRMSGRFLRLQIILPYSSLIFHDGDNLLITYHKQRV